MRILEVDGLNELKLIMEDIKVDPMGTKIMAPKGVNFLIRVNSLSNIEANILKQEMLSLGADAAIARGSLTGRTKKTDCLLMANSSQFNRLNNKLLKQPFGLDRLAKEITHSLTNYQKNVFTLDLGRYKLKLLQNRCLVMAIVNLTPDSFSGDGLYAHPGAATQVSKIVEHVKKLILEGADIIDVGGESSRPGAKPVSLKEELSRTIPVIKSLAKHIEKPVSIDTYKPQVAWQALKNGAVLVNDITGLRDAEMAKVIAKQKAGVIIMHMKGRPQTMQNNPEYTSLIDEIIRDLKKSIETALSNGIKRNKIIIDPEIGFGKTRDHNLELLKSLKEFKILGLPLMVGTSRKSFIGKILNTEPDNRLYGSLAACVLAAENGANILRVHDVKETCQSLKIFSAVKRI